MVCNNRISCLFTTLEPKPRAYPWLTPYLYCAANPIKFIDPTGEVIYILVSRDQELFASMLNLPDQAYISFNEDGSLNMDKLNQCNSNSWLLNMTKLLGNSELKYNFRSGTEFEYRDNENNIMTKSMGTIEYEGAEFEDFDFNTTGVTTGETGFMGKTLLPGNGESGVNSPDDQIYMIVHSDLSRTGKLETLGHEMFGHSLMYEITRDRNASGHQSKMGLIDKNTALTNNIIRARKEIIQNQLRK